MRLAYIFLIIQLTLHLFKLINKKHILGLILISIVIIIFKNHNINTKYVLNQFSYSSNGPYQKIKILEKIHVKIDEFTSKEKTSNNLASVFNLESKKKTYKFKSLFSTNSNQKFGISFHDAKKRFRKNNTNLPKPKVNFNLESNKNDWQSFQILIVPFKNDIEGIEIEVLNSQFQMEAFIGEYVFCNKPAYKTENIGWYVDPLIPLTLIQNKESITFIDKSYPLKINKYENKSIWFNIHASENTFSGKYELPIKIKINNEEQIAILNLNVNDKTLNHEKKFKDFFGFSEHALVRWNDFNSNLIKDKRKDYYDFLLKYNLNPTNIYSRSPWPPIEDWEYCINKGANLFNISYLNEKSDIIRLDSIIKIVYDRNYQKYGVLYGFDEIESEKYNQLIEQLRKYQKLKQKLPFLCTTIPNNKLIDYVDVFIPRYDNINNSLSMENKDNWTYICNVNTEKKLNFFIDYPLENIEKLALEIKHKKFDGFLYYSLNDWNENILIDNLKKNPFIKINKNNIDLYKKGIKWPYQDWNSFSYRNYNGDGCLVYPGFSGEIWPSVRLIQIREMLTILNN